MAWVMPFLVVYPRITCRPMMMARVYIKPYQCKAIGPIRSHRSLLQQFNLPPALGLMHRVIRIQFLMLENMRMLETMTPWDFHGFRKVLADGACTNSPSFHALMTISPCSGMISLTCLLTN